MPNTIRTITQLLAIYADGQAPRSITPQDHRDFVVSVAALISPAFVTLTDAATTTWATNGDPVSQATWTIGGNRTLSITGLVSGAQGTLVITQDGTGSRILTFPAGSKSPGGLPLLSTAAGAKDVLSWVYDGTNLIWTIGKALA